MTKVSRYTLDIMFKGLKIFDIGSMNSYVAFNI